MFIYIIYFIILIILIFLIIQIVKAISRGLEAKNKFKDKEKNSFLDKNNNIIDEIERLKKLKDNRILTKIEFQKIKNKLLNKYIKK